MTAGTLPHAEPAEAAPTPFDIVALVSSAGGLDAISAVLRNLPVGFPTAVLVVQHLGGQGSTLAGILARRTALSVEWIAEGSTLEPGRVYVCPPRMRVEVLPDNTCTLTPALRGALERPFDAVLGSLADSFGARALGVVLTGMGRDGANGARALREAGGTVLVQSEDTAEQPAMPRAVIDAGAADLVLPLHEIGPVLATVVAGGRLPRPRAEVEAADALFAGPGEVRALLRAIDWRHTPLGSVSEWPAALRTTLRLVLESPMPTLVLWGPTYVQLYNDHYRVLMGNKHPAGLGQPNRECWPEAWHLNAPVFARVTGGEPVALRSALYPITRHGSVEDAWFDLFYSPVRDEHGAVAGVLATTVETTIQVLAERRFRTLHRLSTGAAGTTTMRQAFERVLASLAANDQDVPYALGYLLDAGQTRAQLVGAVGVDAGSTMAPHTIDLRGGHPVWPVAKVVAAAATTVLDDLTARFRGFGVGRHGEAPSTAVLLPLRPVGDERPTGVLIAGITARLRFDSAYREFLDLVGAQISASLGDARARQHERARLEQMATLDQAKTEFFSNVSHEFRTPLTLLLSPLEELLRRRDALPAPVAEEITLAARNARRLLALVNTLLDFSRIEAGRLRAEVEPTDLAALTADVASVFRSAVERAGLVLRVDCPPLPGPVWVDRGMWERLVSNLLSNALKFTFAGEVVVTLRALPHHAELVVRDTGVGIPAAELPHVFERFHRVRGTRARTHEGSGIGLAFVHELVRQHNGRVRVHSAEGEGTTFTVWIPSRPRRNAEPALPERSAPERPSREWDASVAAVLAGEAMRWDTRDGAESFPPSEARDDRPGAGDATPLGALTTEALAAGARVLVVDDNADMRNYLRQLLDTQYHVDTAVNGQAALARAQVTRPDLILTDVMMPNLDGFELLRRVRADEALRATPVVLLTARAGEEAAIEGLLAGADDYVAKPFSARELVVRVGAQVALARVRARAAAALRASEARFRALVAATPYSIYRMSPDWGEMWQLDGRGFIADTAHPTRHWLDDYIFPEDQPRVLAVIEAAVRERRTFELEHRVRRVDGTVGWMLSRAVPLFDESGAITEWVGAASDVTARRAGDQALRDRDTWQERGIVRA